MPFLERIFLYPIKALDPLEVGRARITPGGSLERDREFAVFNDAGKPVNGKREPLVHYLRTRYEDDLSALTIRIEGKEEAYRFSLRHDASLLEEWFCNYFGRTVEVKRNATNGFPDDTGAWGPTVVGAASLAKTAEWFAPLRTEDMCRRFRPNLVIGGTEPFWEDRLFASEGKVVRFRIGTVECEGVNPCARCVVPTRDPESGEAFPGFQQHFAAMRASTLPSFAERSRFDHFYRMSVNTRIPRSQAGKMLSVGDEVTLIGTAPANAVPSWV